MRNLFETVKNNVPLNEYVLKNIDAEIKAIGTRMLRVSPCPLCGHRDCYTIYETNQTYYCFSCEATGDVIHLEKHLHRLPSNYEAAQSLAARYLGGK